MTEVVENLRCALSEREKIAKGEELARVQFLIAALEAEKKAVTSKFAERIKAQKERAAELAQDMQTGTEERPVKCIEKPRYRDLLVDIQRTDTNEIIKTRAMQQSERQTSLEQHLRVIEGGSRDDDDDDSQQTH